MPKLVYNKRNARKSLSHENIQKKNYNNSTNQKQKQMSLLFSTDIYHLFRFYMLITIIGQEKKENQSERSIAYKIGTKGHLKISLQTS